MFGVEDGQFVPITTTPDSCEIPRSILLPISRACNFELVTAEFVSSNQKYTGFGKTSACLHACVEEEAKNSHAAHAIQPARATATSAASIDIRRPHGSCYHVSAHYKMKPILACSSSPLQPVQHGATQIHPIRSASVPNVIWLKSRAPCQIICSREGLLRKFILLPLSRWSISFLKLWYFFLLSVGSSISC